MTVETRKVIKGAQPPNGNRFWHEVRGYVEALAVAFLIITFLFTTVGVVGSSMRPTLYGVNGQMPLALFVGDRVFIPKYDTWLRRLGILGRYDRGDIVVVREPENSPTLQTNPRRSFFIKRVIGIPGDHLRIEDGKVYINSAAVDQSFITGSGEITPDRIDYPVVTVENDQIVGFQGRVPGTFNSLSTFGSLTGGPAPVNTPEMQFYYGSTIAALAPLPADAPEGEPFVHELIVPDDTYFLMGDNRQASLGGSEDSLYFGPIDSSAVAGQATAIIWPPRRGGEWNWRRLRPPEAFTVVPEANRR